jgi:transcriptional regulator with XRE-family HTH domain
MPDEAETMIRREIGARLRGGREWAGLEQRTVAEHLGVHADTLRSWESGRRRAPLEQIERIAAYTKVPMWFFRGGWEGWRDEESETDPAFAQRLAHMEKLMESFGYKAGEAVDPLATPPAAGQGRPTPGPAAGRTRRAQNG